MHPGAAKSAGRIGVSQSTTATWELEEEVGAYAALGAAAIGVWLQKLEQGPMREFRFPEGLLAAEAVGPAAETIQRAGLRTSHVVVSGLYIDLDQEARRRRVDHTLAALGWSETLGSSCLLVVPGRRNGLARRKAADVALAALSEILERSEGSPVALAIEPVKEVDFADTLDAALDLAEAINHPRLGVYPDSFHLWRDPGLPEAIERAAGRIAGVHIADARADGSRERLPPGDGVIPLADFVAAVDRTGYAGTYDVELFTMEATREAAGVALKRAVEGLRALLDEALSARGA